MEHLELILTDMTNSIERLGMRWKEKSPTIVVGVYTEYKPGDTVEFFSEWARQYVWTVVEGMEAVGTWLDKKGCSEASLWHRISKRTALFFAKQKTRRELGGAHEADGADDRQTVAEA